MAKKTKETNYGDYVVPAIIGLFLLGFVLYAAMPATHEIEMLDGTDSVHVSLTAPYTTEETFVLIRQLDDKYGTDFRNETLKGNILKASVAEEYLERLEEINATVTASLDENHAKYAYSLLEARENMLQSQIYFQAALAYGRKGTFREDKNCEDEREILEATRLYNLSRAHGARAVARLDQTLVYEPSQSYVGVNKNRPKWFSDVFRDMGHLITTNTEALAMFCENGQVVDPKVEGGSIKRYTGTAST